jgi:hypothetical protein
MRLVAAPVSFYVGDGGCERMAIEGIAVQGLGMQHELAALRLSDRVATLTLQPNS